MSRHQHILSFAMFGLAVVFCAMPASADRISILLGSHHGGASSQFEEENPGVFYTWERSKVALSFGAYRNSYGRLSVATAAGYPLARWDSGEFSAFAGIAHYPDDGQRFESHIGGDIVGLAGVQIRQGNFFLQALPLEEGAANGLLTFGLTFDLDQ